jgi:hypothetical protein
MKLVVELGLCFVVLAQICAETSFDIIDDKFASFQQAHNKKTRMLWKRYDPNWEFQKSSVIKLILFHNIA